MTREPEQEAVDNWIDEGGDKKIAAAERMYYFFCWRLYSVFGVLSVRAGYWINRII